MNLRLPASVLLVAALSIEGLGSSTGDEHAWTPLFNGTDFSGWTFDVLDDSPPESIGSVIDGTILVRGAGRSNGVFRTVGEYGDYELQFEWRWPAEPGNSGCLVHCSIPREMNIWPRCVEVQLQKGDAGDFIHIGETIETTDAQIPAGDIKPWEMRRRYKLVNGQEQPAGEWNEMRVLARGDTLEVFVNGTLVNRGWNGSATRGAICLQAERADVQFRNIAIRARP